jgi:hypothetical protein
MWIVELVAALHKHSYASEIVWVIQRFTLLVLYRKIAEEKPGKVLYSLIFGFALSSTNEKCSITNSGAKWREKSCKVKT